MSVLAALVLAAAVAQADPQQAPPVPHPVMAAALGPVGVAGLLWAQSFPAVAVLGFPNLPGSPIAGLPALAPAAFGLGHLYAGDYRKAGAIAIGAPALTLGSALAVQSAYNAMNPCNDFLCAGFTNLTPFFATWTAVGLGVGVWASWDAYETARSRAPRPPAAAAR